MLDISTSILKVTLKDFPVSDASYVTPTNTDSVTGCFEQGRWYTFDTVNVGKIKQVASEDPAVAFPVWSKRGEPTTQALQQLAVIYAGSYEAETDQYDAQGSFTVGAALTVVAGLLTPVTTTENVHAYVVEPPDSNANGKLRFVVR